MRQMYETFTQKCSDEGRKISEKEAALLIERAHEINERHTSSFTSESYKGNKSLLELLKDEKSRFSDEAKSAIRKFTTTGQRPAGSAQGHGGVIGGGHHHHGGHHGGGAVGGGGIPSGGGIPHHPSDRPHGGTTSPGRPGTSGGGVPHHPSDRPHGGTTSPSRPGTSGGGISGPGAHPGTPSSGGASGPGTNPSAPSGGISGPGAPSAGSGVEGPYGKEILNFVANKRTWECHWFPMQETRANGGDPVNNLYAPKGPLDKLDQVTGGHAREYEFKNNRKAVDEGAEYQWWGHCNNASEAACLLRAPVKSVTYKGVTFTPGDIQGLLVKVTPHLVADRVDFKGRRYNAENRDDPNDPNPDLFLKVITEWAAEGIPFVLDIDPKAQVWNYPYDQVKVYESDKAPEGSSHPGGEGVKFYHIEMAGTGYDKKRRVYAAYIQRDSNGTAVNSGWIKLPNTHANADFMWRPHPNGDLMQKSSWVARPGHGNNPEVDPQVVYDIYMQSIA